MNKTILQSILLIFIISLFVFLPATQMVIAGTPNLLDAWDMSDEAAKSAGYDPNQNNINSIIAIIIRSLLSLLGVIFLGLLIYGGYLWMTDRGNEEQVKRARGLISAAIIGLIIVLSAYAISIFVLDNLASQTLIETSGEESENVQ